MRPNRAGRADPSDAHAADGLVRGGRCGGTTWTGCHCSVAWHKAQVLAASASARAPGGGRRRRRLAEDAVGQAIQETRPWRTAVPAGEERAHEAARRLVNQHRQEGVGGQEREPRESGGELEPRRSMAARGRGPHAGGADQLSGRRRRPGRRADGVDGHQVPGRHGAEGPTSAAAAASAKITTSTIAQSHRHRQASRMQRNRRRRWLARRDDGVPGERPRWAATIRVAVAGRHVDPNAICEGVRCNILARRA